MEVLHFPLWQDDDLVPQNQSMAFLLASQSQVRSQQSVGERLVIGLQTCYDRRRESEEEGRGLPNSLFHTSLSRHWREWDARLTNIGGGVMAKNILVH